MSTLFDPFINGMILSAGLCMVFGPQNTFMLRQGIRHEYPWTAATASAVCEICLVIAGAAGVGAILRAFPMILVYAAWIASAILVWFVFEAAKRAYKGEYDTTQLTAGAMTSRRAIILTAMSFSLLNPVVIMDTLGLIAVVSSRYSGMGPYAFVLGALMVSSSWFFLLAFGGKKLASLFFKPVAWRVLDIVVCLIMSYQIYHLLTFDWTQIAAQ
jgi:L-lysine exporter family protein LysE/ArgO